MRVGVRVSARVSVRTCEDEREATGEGYRECVRGCMRVSECEGTVSVNEGECEGTGEGECGELFPACVLSLHVSYSNHVLLPD